MTDGITVDASRPIAALTEVEKIVSGEQVEVMRYGAALLAEEMHRAFQEQVDPDTGRAWPPRKHEYPWPPLNRTGKLRAMTRAGWGVKTKTGRPRLFGKVEDGFYYGPEARNIVVAGSVFYGRTKHRTRKGTKRPGIAPLTGATPPRPFFGFGRSAQQKFARRYEQLIKAAT